MEPLGAINPITWPLSDYDHNRLVQGKHRWRSIANKYGANQEVGKVMAGTIVGLLAKNAPEATPEEVLARAVPSAWLLGGKRTEEAIFWLCRQAAGKEPSPESGEKGRLDMYDKALVKSYIAVIHDIAQRRAIADIQTLAGAALELLD